MKLNKLLKNCRLTILTVVVLSSSAVFSHDKLLIIPLEGDDLRTVYRIGNTGPAGGIVFHVTDGGRHGLEASHEDQSTGAEWGCSGIDILALPNVGQFIPDPNSGALNTRLIVFNCGAMTAAAIADSYEGPNGITSGWYLPNKEELGLLNEQRDVVGGFSDVISDATYWTSTEVDESDAFARLMTVNGGIIVSDKSENINRVRAIRAF